MGAGSQVSDDSPIRTSLDNSPMAAPKHSQMEDALDRTKSLAYDGNVTQLPQHEASPRSPSPRSPTSAFGDIHKESHADIYSKKDAKRRQHHSGAAHSKERFNA